MDGMNEKQKEFIDKYLALCNEYEFQVFGIPVYVFNQATGNFETRIDHKVIEKPNEAPSEKPKIDKITN